MRELVMLACISCARAYRALLSFFPCMMTTGIRNRSRRLVQSMRYAFRVFAAFSWPAYWRTRGGSDEVAGTPASAFDESVTEPSWCRIHYSYHGQPQSNV